MTKEMKRPTSHISQNSIKPVLSKAVEFYKDNNIKAYECIRERDDYIDYLESKLSNAKPQQALPVVPECVAEFIEFAKTEHLNLFNRFNVVMTDEKVSAWLSDSKAYDSGERRDEILARAWLDGYTVEKPQLFYLKNKITGKYLRSYTGLSMDDRTLRYEEVKDKRVGGFGGGTTFTQSEIGSMETGSYEQIEVN
jgi:hypothetical protein